MDSQTMTGTRRNWVGVRFVLCLLVATLPGVSFGADETFDYVIRGARIIDGTGAPWYSADVAIVDGRIARLGHFPQVQAARVIEASGMILCPGFIDMMGQTATPMLRDAGVALNLLTQGITTINAGEGVSAAPLATDEARRQGWQSMADYFQLLDISGLPVHVVQTVGHTQVRQLVLGDVDRRPSPDELQQMQRLVREAMESGAVGLSSALIYPPAVYAPTEELIELMKPVGECGGRYYTHLRNEGDRLLEAIDEAIDIGKSSSSGVHIFHLKTAGQSNWEKMPLALARIRAARGAGVMVSADIYPYIHNGLGIEAFIHPRHFRHGQQAFLSRLNDPALRSEIRREMESQDVWENWYRHVGFDWNRVVIGQATEARYAKLTGQSVSQIAQACQEDPWDTFFQLVRTGAFVLPQSMSEANVIRAMQSGFVSFCTDVGPADRSSIAAHPRAFGAFPRLLGRYARELGAISFEQAIAQATSYAANELSLRDRGRIAEGLVADLVLFHPDRIADRATFAAPRELSVGVEYVFVHGQLVLDQGVFTGKRPGTVLRGPGYQTERAPYRVQAGQVVPELASFDEAIGQFMKDHHVPGLALAIVDRQHTVYARGFGYADVATREQVTSKSMFRIASLSKPITAWAILRLVDQGKVDLDAPVFQMLPIPDEMAESQEFDQRHNGVTVRHLLQHRGGWDRDKSFDPMFRSVAIARELSVPAPAQASDVIRWMSGQKLDFDPGDRYAYSNYGYCLLGRVIEKATGKSYEAAVRELVLEPLQMNATRLGRSRVAERLVGEVTYYDPGLGPSVFAEDLEQTVPMAYGGWCLEAMDAHGGWVSSVEDLARFAAGMSDEASSLLRLETRRQMFQRPEDNQGNGGNDDHGRPDDYFYSLGWMNRPTSDGAYHWHTGSLDGTSAIIILTPQDRAYVALLNSRVSPTATHLGAAIDPILHEAASKVRQWPERSVDP